MILLLSLAAMIFFIFKSLEENIVYFLSPTEVKNLNELTQDKIRIGGMVKKDSIVSNGTMVFSLCAQNA